MPFFLANMAMAALAKLGLELGTAFVVLLGIAFGGAINIPVKRVKHEYNVEYDSFRMFGLGYIFPRYIKQRDYTIIAVNLGGCIIPVILVFYQLLRVIRLDPFALFLASIATFLNIAVCYRIARPVRGKGIVMPPLIPGMLAALSALILMPDFAPPVAFTAGVMGPLIGADLLHLNDIADSPTGIASIGGAGTFDGIVISGLLALFLV